MIKYILNLFTSDRLADSDDRNAVIECSSRALTFDKTKVAIKRYVKRGLGILLLLSLMEILRISLIN